MKKKNLIIIILLFSLLCLSSCGNADESKKGGLSFTKIETGLLLPVYISYDSSSEKIYVSGAKKADGSDVAIVTIDSTDFEAAEFDYKVTEGTNSISIFPDSNGGFWVFERDPYSDSLLLKRHNSGNELEALVDLKDFVATVIHPHFGVEVYTFEVAGCLYDGSMVIQEQQTAFLIDKSGNRTFSWVLPELGDPFSYDRLRVSGDGIFYFIGDLKNNNVQIYRLLMDGQIELLYQLDKFYPEAAVDLQGRIYLLGWDDSTNLYRLSESGEAELLFGWESVIPSGTFNDIIVLPDNTYFVKISGNMYYVSENGGEEKTSDSDAGRKILKLACYGEDLYIRQRINEFNNGRDDYRIEVIDYSQQVDGVTKMNMDIISGRAPDIILWNRGLKKLLEPEVYASKGILLDLNTFLNDDVELKGSILDNIIKALEDSNGALHELPIEFHINVVAGRQSIVGTSAGWTPGQFFALLEKYPEATLPFGDTPWETLLSTYVANNYDTLIDWGQQKSFFDTADFAKIIEMLAYTKAQNNEPILEYRLIEQGRQLLSYNSISDVSSIQKFTKLLGGEITFIGFPTSRGIGNSFVIPCSLSISEMSEYSDVCWEFLSTLVDYDGQLNNCSMFPVNNEALNERLRNPSAYEEAGAMITRGTPDGDTWSIVFTDATPEESRQVRELIESCDRVHREDRAVMEIIMQDLPSYFNGDKSAEEVVVIIQTRIETYLGEQSK